MRNGPADAPRTYRCLFCGKLFTADQVLFADEIATAGQALTDVVQRAFFSDFVSAPEVVPTRLVYPWNGREAKDMIFEPGEEIPDSVYIRCADGELPRLEEDGAPTRADQGDAMLNALNALQGNGKAAAGARDSAEKDYQKLALSIPEDLHKWINKRICPYCHCEVPRGIGRLPSYRVAMMGGTSSGKTTYMLLAARQATYEIKLANTLGMVLNLAGGELVGESKAYFRQMHGLYMKGSLQGTPITEYIVKPVFPMVLQITPKEDSRTPFFLTLQDFPGEGMENAGYMINSESVLSADGVILLVDPRQMIQFNYSQESGPDNARNLYCEDDLARTCGVLSHNMLHFNSLRKIVVTLSKLDCLYKSYGGMDPLLRRGQYDLLDRGSLKEDHANRVSLPVLDNLHRIVMEIYSSFPVSTGNLETDYRNLVAMLGCDGPGKPDVTLKAISSYSWNEATDRFTPMVNNGAIMGHRLLEPLLELLADAELLPSTREETSGKGLFFLRKRNGRRN